MDASLKWWKGIKITFLKQFMLLHVTFVAQEMTIIISFFEYICWYSFSNEYQAYEIYEEVLQGTFTTSGAYRQSKCLIKWSINESQTLIEKDTSEREHGNGKVKSESGANSFLIGWEIIFFNELLL